MSFSSDMGAIIKQTDRKLNLLTRKVAGDMFRAVILKTPKKTGRAQGNWNSSINKMDESTRETGSADEALARAASTLGKAKQGDVIYLTNSLDYIRGLEYGSSKKQAPQGMVRLTAAQFQIYVDQAARAIK